MRRAYLAAVLLLLGAVLPLTSRGTTWHVPGDYLSIQEAFLALADSDTVMVQHGIYSEALEAPALTFWLMGVVDPGMNQPIVDPSLLPGSTHLACLELPGHSSAYIQDFTFRNGPQMFPRDSPSDHGGIRYGGIQLTLTRCIFDSVYSALMRTGAWQDPQGTLTVTACRFLRSLSGCIQDQDTLPKTIRFSEFSGAPVNGFIYVEDHSVIENCSFDGSQMPHAGEFIWLAGRNSAIRACTFSGPTPNVCNFALMTDAKVCENNVFENLTLMSEVIQGDVSADVDTVRYLRNEFRGCQGQGWMAGGGIRMNGNGLDSSSCVVLIDSCTFDSCTAASTTGFGAISLSNAKAVLTHNVYRGHLERAPSIRLYQSRSEIHDCSFENTGIAVQASGQNSVVNAEFNWWGDSTGPYHENLNPQGLGDTIIGDVDFDPWIGDTAEAITSPGVAIPEEFSLQAYPNPFNPVTMLAFSLPQSARVTIRVYDLTGREVAIMADGRYEAGEHRITFDGSGLATGIYFVRIAAGSFSRTQKVVLLR